jgi:hypothetical protein
LEDTLLSGHLGLRDIFLGSGGQCWPLLKAV